MLWIGLSFQSCLFISFPSRRRLSGFSSSPCFELFLVFGGFFCINYYYYCYYFLLLSWRARVDLFKPRGHIEFCQAMKRLLNNNNNNNNNENNGSNSANNCNSLLLAFGGSLQIGSSGGILGKNLDWSPPAPGAGCLCFPGRAGKGVHGGGAGVEPPLPPPFFFFCRPWLWEVCCLKIPVAGGWEREACCKCPPKALGPRVIGEEALQASLFRF